MRFDEHGFQELIGMVFGLNVRIILVVQSEIRGWGLTTGPSYGGSRSYVGLIPMIRQQVAVLQQHVYRLG